MAADAQAGTARLVAQVGSLKEQGFTYREIAPQLGISPATAWRYHETWLRELRAGVPEVRERVAQAMIEQHEMLRAERLRLEMERDAVLEVLTARHLTVSHGIIVCVNDEPIEDDAPVLAAVTALNGIRDRLLKLADHEAKLLGLYAPVKQTVDATVNYTVGAGVDISALR